jgi:hypothetical protein
MHIKVRSKIELYTLTGGPSSAITGYFDMFFSGPVKNQGKIALHLAPNPGLFGGSKITPPHCSESP